MVAENLGETSDKPLEFVETEARNTIELAKGYVSSRDIGFALEQKEKGVDLLEESKKLVREGNQVLALAFLLIIPKRTTEYEMMSEYNKASNGLAEAYGKMAKICKRAASALIKEQITSYKK